jgi:acetoacetate decarboxylase
MTAAQESAPDVSYPDAPWRMHGQLWLSIFRTSRAVDELRPAGTWGVAFVRYEDPSPLTYGELLVARPVKSPVKAVTISDIWVDSPASVAGGRELWAIPKDLCNFTWRDHGGRVARTEVAADIDGQPVCSASFADVSSLAPRVPFKGATWQPELAEGIGAGRGEKTASLTGSSKALPARATWSFNREGALGWLADARQVASVRMSDFRMNFG